VVPVTDEQHFEDGLAMLKKMAGDAQAERVRQGWREISPDLEHLILEFVAGRIWTRSGLDLKTRSLSTVAALTGMAMGNGATKEEILEIMLHMAPYAGFPSVWDGMKIAARIFDEPA
jgi:4-carboxymuconolactone decarboxylase